MPYTPFIKVYGRVLTVDQVAFIQTQYAAAKADAEAGLWNLPGGITTIPVVTATEPGGAPAFGTSSGKFFRDDGTWAAVPSGGVTNGDLHDHYGGDGAQINYTYLANKPTLGTAAAKDVGTGTGNVADAVHTHSYAPAAEGVTGGNSHDHSGGDGAQIAYSSLGSPPTLGGAAALNVGTGTGTVAAGDHGHGLGSAAAKAVGMASGDLQENGALLVVSQIVETDANGKFITAAKATGYNKALGTTAGTVSEGSHTHTGGAGDVVGPASAVDEQIARFNLATGKLIQASLATIDDAGSVNIPTGQSYKINNVALTAANVGAAPTAEGVTNGNSHDHNGGDGAAIDHVNLSNKGTTTHADIDTALGKLPKPYEAFKRTGTTRPRWYSMPLGCTALGVSGALTSGRFYAIPFVCPKDCTTDYLAINCTTLVAAGKVRLGIYEDSNGEPGAKLIDAGEADTSGTGVKTVACAQALTAGKLYWLVALSNSGTHAFRAPALAGVVNVIGHDVAFPTTHITHFYAAQAYGALPANFPTVTQGTGIVFPLIYVRFSA